MSAGWPSPTLQERLERAEHELMRADMIDNEVRRQREKQRIETTIQAIKREIAAAEAAR